MNPNTEKTGLHPRNKHRFRYDFAALTTAFPPLKSFVAINKYGGESIDFANPYAVKALNKALLKHDYGVENWDIPPTYLCPPIPSRAEYIHQVADVLSVSNKGKVSIGNNIRILDIGMGANCIYPIIGHREYGWQFVGSDVDAVSIQNAEKIVSDNAILRGSIECRLQIAKAHIFKNIIAQDDFFDCTICNPPFHSSLAEATRGTQRKLNNLGKAKQGKTTLNFGGQNAELWCEGGELAFTNNMILESSLFKTQVQWFSTLVSKNENVGKIYALLKKISAKQVKTIEMSIGNKLSRLVFWAF